MQTAGQAYGPAGTLSGNDLFRVTDFHDRASSVSKALPAVAICDGILCAQKDDYGDLTLILKPSQTPPFESPVVSYFLYKGIAASSLLNGDQVIDDSASNATDLTKRIATEWKKQNPNDGLTGSSAALGLDRDANFAHDDGSKIFTDNDPIARLFTYPHKTMQLPTVAAGEVIGSFTAGAGLEIVLQRLGYVPKLTLARHRENTISVPSLAAGPWQPDDAAFFTHWHAKEQVLAYLDPCAYFGAFVQAALYTASATATSKVDGDKIYPDILKTFFNRNIAYLDIRNNYSTSYNLFGLYDDTIRFVSHGNASPTKDKNFRDGSWPILRLTIADVPGSRRGSLHRTRLRLPVGKSSAPAVLVSKGFVTRLGPEKPKYKAPAIAADSADPAFYQPIRLAFAATLDDAQNKDVFSCSYTRVNVYEKIHADPQPAAPLNVAAKEALDGVFRPQDLRLDTDYAGNNFRFDIYPDEVLLDLGAEYGPTYASFVGIAEDASNINFFAFPYYALSNGARRGASAALPSWPSVSTVDGTDFLTKFASVFRPVKITKKTILSDTLSAQIDTIIIRNRFTPGYNPAADRNSIPDCCFVVLSKSDHKQLGDQISSAAGLNSGLPIFLTVASSQNKTDATNNVDYVEKKLEASGYGQLSGSKTSKFAAALNQRVFGNADI